MTVHLRNIYGGRHPLCDHLTIVSHLTDDPSEATCEGCLKSHEADQERGVMTVTDDWTVLVPKDPERRREWAENYGLTNDEKLAIDKWCAIRADVERVVKARAEGKMP